MSRDSHCLGTENRPIVVLLVEDDAGDEILTKRMLEDGPLAAECHVVRDGEEALRYLRREGRYSDPQASPRPDLVLLDLNLPKMHGRDVLQAIRESEELRSLVVVVLTTSSLEEDVARAYDTGASSFVTKPASSDTFKRVMRDLEMYWFRTVTVPTGAE